MASSNDVVSSASFDEFNSQLQGSALKATRNSMLLPSDITFHRSMDVDFAKDLDAFSSRVLEITNNILALVGTTSASGKGRGKLESEEDVVDKFDALVVDSMDGMMERTDMSLDEFLGRNKAPAIAINMKSAKIQKPKGKGKLDYSLQHASHLAKPQLKFKTKVDNSDAPWYPNLPHKYNAQVPLGYNLHDDSSDSRPSQYHPYRYEITHIPYPSHMFRSTPPIPPTPFESTTLKWVANSADLEAMVDELRKATEIAVDLEHHDYRSYVGFLCLMQVSTREQDWIVDLLLLREELAILNQVFTDPKIVKVFHGAESDIVWLQQDLNLYIVNLFDTFHASKVLGFPRHGLANLLEMYCDFTPDKRYQLADWRIRPLPEEMLDYARSDTHFLLYIYDNLRNALLDRARTQSPPPSMDLDDKEEERTFPSGTIADETPSSTSETASLVREVLARSEETALRVYEKDMYDAEGGSGSAGWDTLAKKWNKFGFLASASSVGIPGMQREVYKRVHVWRDKVAREEDESTRYVLPNHYIFQLAEQPPADMPAMLRIFHSVPPVLRRRAKELLDVIREGVRAHLAPDSEAGPTEPQVDVMVVDSMPTSDTSIPGGQDKPEEPVKEVLASASPSLWALDPGSRKSVPSTSSSSLFGPSSAGVGSDVSRKVHQPNSYPRLMAPRSMLFGSTKISSTLTATQDSAGKSFSEVVARIHSNLVIAPSILSVSKVVKQEHNAAAATEQTEEGILPPSVQVEMPFIPASQRQRAVAADHTSTSNGIGSTPTADDSIIVVGQARQKKRKRAKVTGSGNGIEAGEPTADGNGNKSPSAKRTKAETKAKVVKGRSRKEGEEEEVEVEVEPFDFESAPSILDVVSTTAEESRLPKTKKAKQVKGGFYGDFPAPPKAYSELKSGNKSHTFK